MPDRARGDRQMNVVRGVTEWLQRTKLVGLALDWAETKGSGHMLNFFSTEAGTAVCGGMSLTYLIPFSDLSTSGAPATAHAPPAHDQFSRVMPSAPGAVHL